MTAKKTAAKPATKKAVPTKKAETKPIESTKDTTGAEQFGFDKYNHKEI